MTVDQEIADDFAKSLGFYDYGARVAVKNRNIVLTCDGVGTKLHLAEHFKKFDTIGIDLVAMCVNDLLCCGASPTAFMDYYATGTLNFDNSMEIIKGIKQGCEIAGCELVGGETALLNPMFDTKERFDLAGFAVGEVVKPMKETPGLGDYVIGIPSSGLHSNGFTQIREGFGEFEEWMLTPTRIYTKEIIDNIDYIKRCAHVTGGGVVRNLKRVLGGRNYHLFDRKLEGIWETISKTLKMEKKEMLNIFNCGWGMLIISDIVELNIEGAEYIGNVV